MSATTGQSSPEIRPAALAPARRSHRPGDHQSVYVADDRRNRKPPAQRRSGARPVLLRFKHHPRIPVQREHAASSNTGIRQRAQQDGFQFRQRVHQLQFLCADCYGRAAAGFPRLLPRDHAHASPTAVSPWRAIRFLNEKSEPAFVEVVVSRDGLREHFDHSSRHFAVVSFVPECPIPRHNRNT